jgi:hypothetical protein
MNELAQKILANLVSLLDRLGKRDHSIGIFDVFRILGCGECGFVSAKIWRM